MAGPDNLEALRRGGKAVLARRLAALEAAPEEEQNLALLDAAWRQGEGVVLGLTGPPGVGKSSLLSALARAWRRQDRTVGIIAVDPSSRRSGGALLGDRTRLTLDPEDPGLFVRSLAARGRLGGLADLCGAMMVLMRALYDRLIIETVGVGQSESEIRDLADLVLLAVQPAAGDSLQFMKAGIVEIPDLLVVTKADLGEVAERTRRELEAATAFRRDAAVPVLAVSARSGEGVSALCALLEERIRGLRQEAGDRRRIQAEALLETAVREEYGRWGLDRLRQWRAAAAPLPGVSPFREFRRFSRSLAEIRPRPPAGTAGGPVTAKGEGET